MRAERFWVQVDQQPDEGDCWIWQGPVVKRYGKYSSTTAHRAAYEVAIGPIPEGYEVDHLCRVPLCVNPAHLEAVTPEENVRRRYETYTECAKGHPFTPENTYIRPAGWRDCRTCIRARSAAYRERRSAAA